MQKLPCLFVLYTAVIVLKLEHTRIGLHDFKLVDKERTSRPNLIDKDYLKAIIEEDPNQLTRDLPDLYYQ